MEEPKDHIEEAHAPSEGLPKKSEVRRVVIALANREQLITLMADQVANRFVKGDPSQTVVTRDREVVGVFSCEHLQGWWWE